MALTDHWPLFGLRITTPRLELRIPSDDDLAELVELVRQGIHDPATMPFGIPWTDLPSPAREQDALRYWWRCRAELRPDDWQLGFAVVEAGRVVGTQALHATGFPVLRTAETGSWLGQAFHGTGIGTEMRAAVVHFAFEQLGAAAITSAAFLDNTPSHRVSLKTGYEPNGVMFSDRRGQRAEQTRYLLTRERWLATRTALPVEVTGYEPCRTFLGLA